MSLTRSPARTVSVDVQVSPRAFGRSRRDLRLGTGIALVAVSVLLGSRVVAAATSRTTVQSLRTALSAGATVTEEDLAPRAVGLDDVSAYVTTSADAVGRTMARNVGSGELLPVAALAATISSGDLRLVTVAVDPLHAPPNLARGERVDVWVSAKDGVGPASAAPTLAIAGALVDDPGITDDAGGSQQIGVVVAVPSAQTGRVVAAVRMGEVDLVRVPS